MQVGCSPEARSPHLKAQAKQPTIGQLVDDAMTGIERDNPALKDVIYRGRLRFSTFGYQSDTVPGACGLRLSSAASGYCRGLGF